MADSPAQVSGKPEEASDLKRKLVMRVGFAGLMIVLLLATLAVFDRMNAPEEAAPAEPRFTEPVPVGRKEVTQPVTPAEPAAESGKAPAPAAEPEASALPVDKSVAPSGPPPRPTVAAQPHLPRTAGPARAQVAESAPAARSEPVPATPPAPLAPASAAAPAHAAPHPEAAARPASPAAPGVRLFSGYALQAGVFSDTHRAEELHAKLTLNGIPSTIESRVQVGPFKTREEAEAARAKMKALGIEALLLPPPKAAQRR